MAELYEIVIFTASLSQYAKPLICHIDKNWVCSAQLYREHCTFHKNLYFVKDLSKLGRDLKDVIIVDNSPSAYMFQPENAISITSWYQDSSDRELYKLVVYLSKLSNVEDVRDFLSRPKLLKFISAPGSPKKQSIERNNENDQALKLSISSKILIKKKNGGILKTTKSSNCDSIDNKWNKIEAIEDSSPQIKGTSLEVKLERIATTT